jgi:hypothetical protein
VLPSGKARTSLKRDNRSMIFSMYRELKQRRYSRMQVTESFGRMPRDQRLLLRNWGAANLAPEIMKFESYRSTEHISGLSFFDLIYELSIGVSVVVILFACMALIIWLIDYSVARYESRKLAYSN